jgi:predicted house-cleaning noncanonical NTP pyrophosphatase (MazG superfamily)
MTALIESRLNATTPHSFNDFNTTVNSTHSDITVIDRIDSILRFSKHLVAVIDRRSNNNHSLAGKYIESLSKDSNTHQQTNIAFLSSTTVLNDIQLRCRIVEQLFTGSMFDPELSLASIIPPLTKNLPVNISIVVEEAQLISTTIIVELSELSFRAKKLGLPLNIVLFGNLDLAKRLATDKETFAKKLTLITSEDGLILNLKKLSNDGFIKNILVKNKAKVLTILLVLSVIISGTWFGIEQHEILPFLNQALQQSDKTLVIKKKHSELEKNNLETKLLEKGGDQLANENTFKLASTREIFNHITGNKEGTLADIETDIIAQPIASSFDIAQQLSISNHIEIPISSSIAGNISGKELGGVDNKSETESVTLMQRLCSL